MGKKGPKGIERVNLVLNNLKVAKENHKATIERLKNNGVYFVDENRVVIAKDAQVGKDTIIYPDVIIEEEVIIGEGNIIYPGCRINKSTIGNFNELQGAVIIEAKLGNNIDVGPYAYIRPESCINDNVKIGDFVEIKKSTIDEGTKVSHLTYIGDAQIGKNVNFGCGTVFVNYDGINKHKTEIGDNSFIGCNTNLVAPVKLGKNVYTAAGTTVTHDVEDGSLVVGRCRQEVKEGYVEKKGLLKK